MKKRTKSVSSKKPAIRKRKLKPLPIGKELTEKVRNLEARIHDLIVRSKTVLTGGTMIKKQELADPNSCINRAHDDEMTFVLLGRDRAAPVAIRAWIGERLRLGKNNPDDPQIVEAEETANLIELSFKDGLS